MKHSKLLLAAADFRSLQSIASSPYHPNYRKDPIDRPSYKKGVGGVGLGRKEEEDNKGHWNYSLLTLQFHWHYSSTVNTATLTLHINSATPLTLQLNCYYSPQTLTTHQYYNLTDSFFNCTTFPCPLKEEWPSWLVSGPWYRFLLLSSYFWQTHWKT